MAGTVHSDQEDNPEENQPRTVSRSRSDDNSSISYLGLAFALHLAAGGPVNRAMVKRVAKAEEELEQMRSRRKEDAKANARVVEIFASHRHAWQQEERRLHRQIHESAAEVAGLRAKVAELEQAEVRLQETVEELRRDVSERTEMMDFMSRRMMLGDGEVAGEDEFEDGEDWFGKFRVSEEVVEEESGCCLDENGGFCGGVGSNEFNPEILGSAASKFWGERANLWQV